MRSYCDILKIHQKLHSTNIKSSNLTYSTSWRPRVKIFFLSFRYIGWKCLKSLLMYLCIPREKSFGKSQVVVNFWRENSILSWISWFHFWHENSKELTAWSINWFLARKFKLFSNNLISFLAWKFKVTNCLIYWLIFSAKIQTFD